MRTRKMSKMLATILSAAMVMSMSMTAFAADGDADSGTTTTNPSVEAPIYSYDVINVVVPSNFAVAFNPDKLSVETGAAAPSTDSVLSKSYGIVNKSSKDKIVTVSLTVEDQNDKITFVNSAAEVTAATKDDYVIYLEAVPAGTSAVTKDGTTAIDKDTSASDLADVSMTKSTTKTVPLSAGENQIAFKLSKAVYEVDANNKVELGTTNTNNVKDHFTLKELAASNAGVTAFTFAGAVNDKADWTKLTSSVKISAVYSYETADGTETIATGTGALYENPAPKFSTGTSAGVINFTAGTGDDAFKELVSITAPWNGQPFDLTASTTTDASAGTITVAASKLSGWANKSINPVATITYKNVKGDTKTATVTFKSK